MANSVNCLVAFLSLVLCAASIQAQPAVYIKEYNQLYWLELSSGAELHLYTSQYPEIRTVKVSADGSLFALVEVDHSGKVPVNYFKVFDANGRLKYQGQRDVREYAWDPTSNRLAYITGTFREGGVSFVPTGFYLYDFSSDKETRIMTDGFEPVAINWVSNAMEDAIYVKALSQDPAKRFLRYDVLRPAFESSPFRSVELSPDGKYYSDHDVSCRCIKIFDRSTQVERANVKLTDGDVPAGWVYNKSHLYAVRKTSFHKTKHQMVVGSDRKTATLNGGVKDATITVVDGSNGQHVQTVSGVLPSLPPYQFMFSQPALLISIFPATIEDVRQAPGRNFRQISVTAIPEKYRE